MSENLMPVYARADLLFERGEGSWLYDKEGRKYLDCASGVAVNALGHAHPRLIAALTRQAQRLWHCSNLYRVEGQEKLSQHLASLTFAEKVFFCNSGAEAVEACIKLVRKYHDETGNPNRYRIITCENAFHGRTLATIAAGRQAKHLKGFEPMVEGFDQVPFGNLNALRAAITPETAAVMVEPVQGEGGINPASREFLQGLRQACDEFGLLLIFDEVQTGMGRTGSLFAYQEAEVAPDVMAVAKGLGAGFPVGACLASAKAAIGMTAGSHGSTFGGNPLAMAVANEVLDIMTEPGFLPQVKASGEKFLQGLKEVVGKYPLLLKEARGRGLLLGLECAEVLPNTQLVEALAANGLITVVAGCNVVRFVPPLNIKLEEIEFALQTLSTTLQALQG